MLLAPSRGCVDGLVDAYLCGFTGKSAIVERLARADLVGGFTGRSATVERLAGADLAGGFTGRSATVERLSGADLDGGITGSDGAKWCSLN
ncbi:MAG: hypothetical protein LBH17_07260 [Oscillospiraceae bacterium]|jgi:hypothetical protein|nr:hypothetical protein [Oscillospiraceae bacterium]